MVSRLIPVREAILAGAILVLLALVASRFAGFVAPANLANVFNDTAPLIILALGQMVVILTRCIDLSVAANLALTGMTVAMINVAMPGLPIPVIIAVAIALGAVMGAINGLLAFTGFPRAAFLGLPVLSWAAIATILVFGVMMARTPLGRSIFAVGGNPHAAVYAGIGVGRTQFLAFVISGALAGLTGYLWVARYAVAYVDIAGGFELEVVAACVIGGISIAGGIGSVGGAVLGAIFLGVVKNALPVVDISPFWQLAISGSAILIAVAFNARAGKARGRIILKSTVAPT